MEEHFFQCPHCWQDISMLIDISQHQQNYIEDCEVCCNPIQLQINTDGQKLLRLEVQSIEQ